MWWSPSSIQAFLFYGYLPHVRADWKEQPWANVTADETVQSWSEATAIRESARAFGHAFRDDQPGPQIVLLSGGYDSRAILAALLERYDSREIVATTFGTPRTLDFQLGAMVARHAHVEHVPIDLTTARVSEELIVRVADELRDTPMWLFGSLSNRISADVIGEGTYWSGYLGGPITGSHVPTVPSTSWEEALIRHAKRPPFVDSSLLIPSGFDPAEYLPDPPRDFASPLTLDERIDLVIRQHTFLAPEHIMQGHRCRTPFLSPEFLHVLLNAAPTLRNGQFLYRRMLTSTFPKLFTLPTKDDLGLPKSAGRARRALVRARLSARRRLYSGLRKPRFVPISVNHVEWNEAFRRRDDFKLLASKAVDQLSMNTVIPWCNLKELFANHMDRRVDAGLSLSQLISFEVFFGMRDESWRE